MGDMNKIIGVMNKIIGVMNKIIGGKCIVRGMVKPPIFIKVS
jgi:hypothetical protein